MSTSTLPQYHNTSYSNSTKHHLSPVTLLLCCYVEQHLFSHIYEEVGLQESNSRPTLHYQTQLKVVIRTHM
jgi:hypothetical protein